MSMKFNKFFLVLFLGFGLASGCAQMEEHHRNTCQSTNWKQLGFDHSAQGKEKDASQIRNCESYAGKNIVNDYADGYTQGLKKFCTYEFGVYWGRNGKDYAQTCPAELENNFLSGYSKGKLEYDKLQLQKSYVESTKPGAGFNTGGGIADGGYTQPPAHQTPTKSCFMDSDCVIADKCIQPSGTKFMSDRICEHSHFKCTLNSDCELRGRCEKKLCVMK